MNDTTKNAIFNDLFGAMYQSIGHLMRGDTERTETVTSTFTPDAKAGIRFHPNGIFDVFFLSTDNVVFDNLTHHDVMAIANGETTLDAFATSSMTHDEFVDIFVDLL